MTEQGGLLAIFAHPDDETFGVGGTMAHCADRGVPVTMVSATRGEVGEIAEGTEATAETLGTYREQELRDAMAILGVTDVRFLDFRDSGMHGTPENGDPRNLMNAKPEAVVGPLVRIIRQRRPQIVATWDASGGYGHPDHIAVHERATEAFHAAADGGRYPDAGAPWQTPLLFFTAIPMEEFGRVMEEMRESGVEVPDFVQDDRVAQLPRVAANCIIDVSEQYERKLQAMLAHRTQITDTDPFMRMPEHVQRRFFGREYFHRAYPPLPDGATISEFTQGP